MSGAFSNTTAPSGCRKVDGTKTVFWPAIKVPRSRVEKSVSATSRTLGGQRQAAIGFEKSRLMNNKEILQAAVLPRRGVFAGYQVLSQTGFAEIIRSGPPQRFFTAAERVAGRKGVGDMSHSALSKAWSENRSV